MYSIKEAAAKMNLTAHTLRYYDQEGLLPSLKRDKNGTREFSDGDLEWLGLICCLKSTGMPIKQIREFVELSMQGDQTLKSRCELLQEHKQHVEEEIEMMQHHLEKVTHKIQYFDERCREYNKKQT